MAKSKPKPDEDDDNPSRPTPKRPPTSAQWWRAAEMNREPHEILNNLSREMRQSQSARFEAYKRQSAIYGSDMSAFGMRESLREVFEERLALNELANAIETLQSQIFKNRIVPSPQSVGADWFEQERARKLGRWLDGVYDECNFFEDVIPVAGLDTLVWGTGLIKVGSEVEDDEGCMVIERIPTIDVRVDDVEGRYGKPRSMYQDMLVDRFVLLDKYGCEDDRYHGKADHRAQCIEDLTQSANDHPAFEYDRCSDQILVTFAWHLPSGKHAKDGRYTLAIKNCTLEDNMWKRTRFPFAPIRYGVPQGSYWGNSAVARLAPAQREYDKLNGRIQDAHDVIGIPRIIVQKGSKISKQQIDDVIGSILECDGPAPTEWNAQPIHPDAYSYRQTLPDSMRGLIGISSFSSQGDIPAGLSGASGVALERYEDTENARHAFLHRSYESAVTTVAELCMDEARELEERGISVEARAKDDDAYECISWRDVAMDRKKFVLRIPPASALPKTPAAKEERLLQLLDKQAISMAAYRRLSDIGDTESADSLDTSDEDIILKNLASMVKTGDYVSPISLDDLQLAITLAGKFYNSCRRKGVPGERLALITQYIDDATALLNPPMPAPDPGAMPPGGPVGPPPPDAGMPVPPGPMPPDPMMDPSQLDPMGNPLPPMDPGAMQPEMDPMGAPPMPPMGVAA